ncbi:MAG: undecaprenyldiphospho-muramoylpentapeptide beta-N-acetylglucosaminyltransferase [Candidatus Omnitrophica bacterium]|nr:undecaprenyldiphospho-muramoylpentapeptide beta-N-acetylglucosaminyltransferase [Candidatus Omnitrophota bacterium]
MALRVLMAAGGTGGHLIPALTVARLLKQQDPENSCLAVSGENGMGEALWDHSLGEFQTFPVWPWPKGLQIIDPRYWGKQLWALVRMFRIMKRFKPQVVIGFGGYAAGPAVLLARMTGTPAVIHEQNVFPGRTTQLLVSWANRVAVSFKETAQHLPKNISVAVTGNPVRPEIACPLRETALQALGLSASKPVLLIVGGSQGSHHINKTVVEAFGQLPARQRNLFQVLHLTGSADVQWVAERYRALGIEGRVEAFSSNMGWAYSVAHLAVARAGATTLAELIATETPSFLVPYPHAGAHQAANAQWLAGRGGAVAMDQEVFTADRVVKFVIPLLTDRQKLNEMRASLKVLRIPDAAQRVVEMVLEAAHAAYS